MDYGRSTPRDGGTSLSAGYIQTCSFPCPRPACQRRFRESFPIPNCTINSIAALPHFQHAPQPRPYIFTTRLPIPLTYLQHHLTVPCCLIIVRPPHSNESFDWTPRAAIHSRRPSSCAHKYIPAIAKLDTRLASPVNHVSTVMR